MYRNLQFFFLSQYRITTCNPPLFVIPPPSKKADFWKNEIYFVIPPLRKIKKKKNFIFRNLIYTFNRF